MSPYPFILAVESMTAAIRNSDKIKRFVFNEKHVNIGQYADDTFLLLNGTSSSLKESLHILELFYYYSGLKINMKKKT